MRKVERWQARTELARSALSVLPRGSRIRTGPFAGQLHSSFCCALPDGTTAWLKLDREMFVDAGVVREASCLRELSSSNFDHVPRVLDSGQANDGTQFMLTTHIDGTRLDHHLANAGSVNWTSVIDWLRRWNMFGNGDRVHGSFDTRNILLLEDGSLGGILDFEAHRAGSIECDLASLVTDVAEACALQSKTDTTKDELLRIRVAAEQNAHRELDVDQIVALTQQRISRRVVAGVLAAQCGRTIGMSILDVLARPVQ